MSAITRQEIAKHLVEKIGFNNRVANEFVDAFFDSISDVLGSGKNIALTGFGNFVLRDKNGRPGRNPRTGEYIYITPRRVVVFKPAQKIKDRVAFHGEREQH